MKATRFTFRFRLLIVCGLYALGFWAPWERYSVRASSITSTWLELIGAIASVHWLSLNDATLLITGLAIACAFTGAALRIWGTAYLGAAVMLAASMQAGSRLAAGPYRHVRNPLYLGSLLTALAAAVLMPPQGAVFFLLALALFELRLILGEEAFLSKQLGETYLAYKQRVPRLVPSPRPRVPSPEVKPRWLEALLAEVYPVAFAVCFAVLGWQYNSQLLIKALMICFGASLVARAMLPRQSPAIAS